MTKHFVMAYRLAASRFGAAAAPLKRDGEIELFDSEAEALARAHELNSSRHTPNVSYAYGGTRDVEF